MKKQKIQCGNLGTNKMKFKMYGKNVGNLFKKRVYSRQVFSDCQQNDKKEFFI